MPEMSLPRTEEGPVFKIMIKKHTIINKLQNCPELHNCYFKIFTLEVLRPEGLPLV